MPRRLYILPRFEEDADEIEDNSLSKFGQRQTDRYMSLVEAALDIIADDPLHPVSRSEDEWARSARSFHLRHARRAARAAHRIYYFVSDDAIVAARLLHDSMDPKLHSPDR